jgi:type I restriction enzyme, S subunit
MSERWRSGKLGDFVELKRGYDLPSSRRTAGPIPLLSSSGVTDHVATAMVRGPGVITGRYGTLGQVYFVDVDYWPLNTTLYVKDFKGNDPRFVSYFLRTIDFFSASDKAAVPGVNRNHLHELNVNLPDLPEQEAIARILSGLDDRIELLRETNATLEGIAQALFKSWFVDFDPVRAKSEGRTPEGMDATTAALFPDTFQDSPLGPIPSGWKVESLGSVAAITKGKSYRSEELASSPVALVTLKSFRRGGGYRTDGLKEFTGAFKPEQRVHAGDLVISYTDVTQAADIIGRPALILPDDRYEALVISLDVGVIRPKHVAHKTWYFGLLNEQRFRDHVLAHTTGTTVLHLLASAVPSFTFASPGGRLIDAFEGCVGNLLVRVQDSARARSLLSDLRDELIPRLISGRLRLRDNGSELGVGR